MKKLISLTVVTISLFLGSCDPAEKDFIGKYRTYFRVEINIPSNRSQDPNVVTGKEFEDLSELGLDLFKDTKGGGLAGECTLVRKFRAGFLGSYYLSTEKTTFEVVNLRLDGDTLLLSLQRNIGNGYSDYAMKAKLARSGDGAMIGLEADLLWKKAKIFSAETSPFFLRTSGGFAFFACPGEAGTKDLIVAFFEKQKSAIGEKINSETDQRKRKVLENSLKEVSSRVESNSKRAGQ